jgi:hypothetical protein
MDIRSNALSGGHETNAPGRRWRTGFSTEAGAILNAPLPRC